MLMFDPPNINKNDIIEKELEPIKQIIITKNYSDLKWLVPTTNDHTIEISKDTENLAILKRWCEQNCEDTVGIWADSDYPHICFFFFRITDAMAFKLRWI